MGITINAPKQDGNARFNSLKVNLTSSVLATRAVLVDNDGNFFASGSFSGGGGGGTGTVTNVSVVTANGLAGDVATPTTTPAITIKTSVTGLLKGNGTAISAATAGTDYISSTVGTASYASQSLSSSYAATASLPLRGLITASVNLSTITFTKGDGSQFNVTVASDVATSADKVKINNTSTGVWYPTFVTQGENSQSIYVNSASFAYSASINTLYVSTSYAISSSRAITSSFAITASNAITSSFAITSSYSISSSFSTTSSYSVSSSNSLSASYAITASNSISSSYAIIASNSITASYAISSSYSLTSSYAISSSYALSSSNSISASYSISSSYALSSSYSLSSSLAQNAITSSYPVSITGSTIYSTAPATALLSTNNVIALGNFAGGQSNLASYGVFLGYQAGYQAYTASNSIFIGQLAGASAEKANNSNFLGNLAGYLATFADNSNFFGLNSGQAATSASYSNFLGHESGYQAYSASYSTLLGFRAGRASTQALSIGSNNIIIGTNISLASKVSNAINIGGIIFGSGSYSNVASNTFSGSANGKIGINNPNPIETLDISGSLRATASIYFPGMVSSSYPYLVSVDTASGKLYYTNQFTGSLLGTASYANYASQSLSSSYAITASYFSGSINGDFNVNGTIYATKIVATTIVSLTELISGSTIHGSLITNTHQITGSVTITGSLDVIGATTIRNLSATGSLFGTSSWAQSASYYNETDPIFLAKSASLATTGSNIFIGNQIITGSLTMSGSISITGNISASSFTGSLLGTSSYAVFASQSLSSSYAATASSADNFFIRQTLTVSGSSTTTGSLLVSGSNQIIGTQIITGSQIISGSQKTIGLLQITGSLNVSGSITGSLLGTASYSTTSSLPLLGLVTASATVSTITFTKGDNSTFAITLATDVATSANTVKINNTNSGLWYPTFVISGSATQSLYVNSASFAYSASQNTAYVTSSQAITASYSATASIATSASYAATASIATTSSFAATASSAENFTVRGTLTAQTIIVQTITSSIDYVTGSTRFGSASNSTHQFTGSVSISGSLTVIPGVINSLTASYAAYASQSLSSSYAATASVATSASYAATASIATSSSYAATASNILGGATNYIPLWTSATALSSSVIYQTGGNIGIGTTTPTSSLEIFSNAPSAARTLPHNVLTITAESDNYPYEGFGGGIHFKNRSYTAGILSSARVRSVLYFSGNPGQDYGAGLAFDTTPTTSSALTEAIRIRYDGNVGIGITTPSTKLHVTGSVAISVDGSSQDTSPYAPLGVTRANTASNLAYIGMTKTGVVPWGIGVSTNSSNSSLIVGTVTANTQVIAAPIMAWNYVNSRVGINTITPTGNLHIYDTNDPASTLVGQFQIGGNNGVLNDIYLSIGTHKTGEYAFINAAKGGVGSRPLALMGGNVGIDTTGPVYKLDVSGIIRSYADATYLGENGTLIAANSSSLNKRVFIGYDGTIDAGFITAVDSGTTYKNLILNGASLGNVGIGKTNPTVRLDVSGSSGTGAIRTTDATSPAFYLNNVAVQWKNYIPASSNDYKINDGVADYVTIKYNSGNVGIGTTTPASILEIKNADPNLTINQTTNTNNSGIKFQTNGNPIGYITAQGSNGNMNINMGPSAGWGGYITFQTDTTESVRITSARNVGIGKTDPTYKLDINSSSSLSSASGSQLLSQRIQGSTGNNDYLEITNTRVVDGSDWQSAGFRLQQRVDNTFMGYLQFNGNNNNYGVSFGTGGDTTSPLSAIERMRINSSGYVGIGTVTPGEKLSVVGNISASAYIKSGGTSTQFLKADGTVDSSTYITAAQTYYIGTTSNALNRASTAQTLTGVSIDGNAATVTGFKNIGNIAIQAVVGTNQSCTTAQFLTWYQTNYTFKSYYYTVAKCTWDYAGNNDISDTSIGACEMAGTVIETFSDGTYYTIRITRPTTGTGGFVTLVYNDQGSVYSPGWRTDWNSSNLTNLNQLTNGPGYTTNTGTVTSVATSGTVSGLTLTGGTITTTGTITLGGTLSLTSGNVTTALGFTPYNSTNPSGYITAAQSYYIGTTSNALNRASAVQNLTGINIDGNSGTATYAGLMSIDNTVVYGRSGLQFAQSPGPAGNSASSHQTPTDDWWHVLRMNHGNNAGYYADLAVSMTTNLGLSRRVISNGSQFSNWVTILDALNYNSYAPTLTGTGASGTWGISITGNAATVTDGIVNTTDTYTATPKITNIVTLSAAEYAAIGSPSTSTLYIII